DLLQKFDKCFGATGRNYGKVTADRTMADIEKRRADRWNFLFIAGMWFQDLFNYDFRRTEQCIIPYATQEGEISFCAYNTGIGWRNIIEKMHMTATLTKWYDEHGRHEIFAGGKKVGMGNAEHTLILHQEHVDAAANDTLDKLGIAKNSREEKIRARDAKLKQDAENAQMARLYREHVLGEKPVEGLVSINSIAPAPKAAPVQAEEPVMGD
ncbi:MAG: radical SAM protein, partial [Silvibacterium sp.]|nr:radical SAM protein [Silvibacterium sp.]